MRSVGHSIHVRERSIQSQILELLEAWRVPARAMVTGVRSRAGARAITGGVGVPDILGWLPWGQGLAIEVKRPGGKLRPEQARWIVDTAAQSPWTMIIVATSLDQVCEAIEPKLQTWRNVSSNGRSAANFWTLHHLVPQCTLDSTAIARDVLEREGNVRRPGMPESLFAGRR